MDVGARLAELYAVYIERCRAFLLLPNRSNRGRMKVAWRVYEYYRKRLGFA